MLVSGKCLQAAGRRMKRWPLLMWTGLRLDTRHKMKSPDYWLCTEWIAKRSEAKSVIDNFQSGCHILLYLWKGHVGSPWLSATHVVAVKNNCRSYLQLLEASRDRFLVCPHRKREHHKPKRIKNETTRARIYEVLKLSPTIRFEKLTMKNSRMLTKVRDAEKGARRMTCQQRKKRFPCSLGCIKKKARVCDRKPLSLKLRAPLPTRQYLVITNIKELSWVIMT